MFGLTINTGAVSVQIAPAPAPSPPAPAASAAPTPDGPATIVTLSEPARLMPSLVETLRAHGFTDARIGAIAKSLPASVFEGETAPDAPEDGPFTMPADLSGGMVAPRSPIQTFDQLVKARYGLTDEQAAAWSKAFFEQKALAATRMLADELRLAVQRQRDIVSGEN